MGFFKKIFKGIGKVFKKVGGWIKKGWAKVGKFMNKFGILGQVGMMYLTSLIGGYALQFLGKIGSGVMGKLVIAAKNGSKWAKAALTVVHGVKSVAKIPRAILKESSDVLGSITDVVTETVGDTLKFIGDKTGISAALRKTLPSEGFFSKFRPDALQGYDKNAAGDLVRDEAGNLVKTGNPVAPPGLTPEGYDTIFLNFKNRLSNVLPTAADSGVDLVKGISEGVTDFGKVITGQYVPDYRFETYMIERKPSLLNPDGKPKKVTRNVLNPENAADYNTSIKKYTSQTSNYGGRQDYEDFVLERSKKYAKDRIAAAWLHDQDLSNAKSLLGRGEKSADNIIEKASADEVGTQIYEKSSKVASKGPNLGDTAIQTFATAGINELLYGSPEQEAPYASYQAMADTSEYMQPLTRGPTAGQEIDTPEYAYNNPNDFFSSYGMQAEDETGTYNAWAPQVSMYPRA